jgi:hypothetical protein
VVVTASDSMHILSRLFTACVKHMLVCGLSVVLVTFSLDDFQGIGRADIETGTHPITVDLLDQHGFILVIQDQCSFGTGICAQAASVAQVPIYLNYFSNCHFYLLFLTLQ